jgi:hypothetical protein
MHASRGLSCIMWKDKCPVLLISIHALLVGFPCMPVNMYILYLHACKRRPNEVPTPMTHLEFKNALCECHGERR